MEEKILYKLVNPSLTFEFGDKSFQVKKANLEMVVQYQMKLRDIQEKKEPELSLISYCIYLVLNKADSTITEQWVKENTPGDIDVLECFEILGFISPKGRKIAQAIQEKK
jgi:hypothetical protein